MPFTAGYKVNENTQYEFTVSNETIAEAVQAAEGITESDIAAYCYTALIDSRIKSVFIQSSKNVMEAGFDGWQAENMPYYFIRDTRYVDSNDDINKDDTVYERNFITWNGTIYPGTPQEKQGTFLVMDMKDIKRWYVDFNAGMFTSDTFASEITEGGVTSVFPGYNGSGYTYLSSTINEPVIHSDNNDPLLNPDEDIHIVNVLVINNELWIGQLNPSCHGEANTGIFQSTYNQYVNSYVQGYLDSESSSPPPIIYQRGSDSWAGIAEIKEMDYPDLGSRTTVYRSYIESSDGVLMEINGNSGGTFDVRTDSGAHCKDLNTLLTWQSWCGLKFTYDNVMYKPIIQQGVIVGYTDDMSEPSEYDEMTNVTGNNISPVPPGPVPPGPGPYDDDPWHGVSFSGVGVGGAGAFAKCYYMTSTELANLRSWMNSNNVPEGFDPMAQIIGLSQVPVNLSGDDNTTVQFVNSSAVYDPGVTRLVDSGVSTQISMGTPKRYSLGSVNITRRMQERGEPYLDYDCQIELYLPLIGMFSLDTQAIMGRTITAEAVLDPISGTLAAYAYVTRDGQNLPIAYGSTTIGVDLPISAQQYSVARAALKQANAQLGTSLLSSTLSFIAAATAGGKGSGTGAKTATGSTNGLAAAGIREAGADYMKASQAGNVFGDFMQWGRTIRQLSYGNNTAIAGSFGGSTAQWSYPFTPYVKIIRPRYEKPSNYAHSQGVPCIQTKTVGSCTGFIQCIGVDVSGITGATDIELQAIQAALTNGVFAGGGS